MAESKRLELPARRIRTGAPAKLILGLAAGLILVVVLIGGWYGASNSPTPKSGVLQSQITPSPDVNSGEALRNLRATENAQLNTYGWVDRKNGVIRIPIERAMDLLLERGLPVRPVDEQP